MPQTWNDGAYFASVRRRIEATERNVQQVVAETAAEAFSGIVEKTPVDTGRARASWQLQPIDRFSWRIVSESTSYIHILEYGFFKGVGPKTVQTGEGIFSSQAPAGMVRITIMELEKEFQRDLANAVETGWRAA